MTVPDAVSTEPWIGIVVVSFRAADFIAECLESLVASGYPKLKILVVDNASPDRSVDAVRDWASGTAAFKPPEDWPFARKTAVGKPRPFAEFDAQAAETAAFDALAEITLIHSGANRGYAGGANVGLRALRRHPEIELFWVLNPDCVVDPAAPAAFAAAALQAGGRFALMGGRASYFGEPEIVQADGGQFRRWLGRGGSVNKNCRADACTPPDGSTLDYIHGMSMIASRLFIDRVGLMDSSWFLYFEEVDWAYRRGDLPLLVVPEARVRHRAGASSKGVGNTELPSPLSSYVFSLNGMRFTARWHPLYLPLVYATWLFVVMRRFLRQPSWTPLWASLCGLHGLPPPAAVRRIAAPQVWETLARRDQF